jgi:hypothetical protein
LGYLNPHSANNFQTFCKRVGSLQKSFLLPVIELTVVKGMLSVKPIHRPCFGLRKVGESPNAPYEQEIYPYKKGNRQQVKRIDSGHWVGGLLYSKTQMYEFYR